MAFSPAVTVRTRRSLSPASGSSAWSLISPSPAATRSPRRPGSPSTSGEVPAMRPRHRAVRTSRCCAALPRPRSTVPGSGRRVRVADAARLRLRRRGLTVRPRGVGRRRRGTTRDPEGSCCSNRSGRLTEIESTRGTIARRRVCISSLANCMPTQVCRPWLHPTFPPPKPQQRELFGLRELALVGVRRREHHGDAVARS